MSVIVRVLAIVLVLPLAACAPKAPPAPALDEIAESYVRLALAVGRHDGNYIDAYYGPPEWKADAEAGEPRPLPELAATADRLLAELDRVPPQAVDAAPGRAGYLRGQLRAMRAWLGYRLDGPGTFDDEAKALYGVEPPRHDAAYFDERLAAVDAALPGDGTVQERMEAHRKALEIPADRLDALFSTAVDEARSRTLPHVALPAGERFSIEYVSGRPWGAYNWYQGGGESLIQVNTELPNRIDRVIDLAAHEGYPGHHVYNALLERALVDERGWKEFSVYILFSPQSLIAEGTANFGIEVAFPGEERLAYDRDVLAPMAGVDPAEVELEARLQPLLRELAYAGNEAARGYLDGAWSADETRAWLARYEFATPERSAQRLRFFDTYRSYVVNYNLGKDLVRRWVEAQGGTADDPERRWEVFTGLLASPRLPMDLESDLGAP